MEKRLVPPIVNSEKTIAPQRIDDMAGAKSKNDTPTREQIMDAAEAAVLAKGFNSTSIEELIAAVGISKSGFFYHFVESD